LARRCGLPHQSSNNQQARQGKTEQGEAQKQAQIYNNVIERLERFIPRPTLVGLLLAHRLEHVREVLPLLLGAEVRAEARLEEAQAPLLAADLEQLHRPPLVRRKAGDLLDERANKHGALGLELRNKNETTQPKEFFKKKNTNNNNNNNESSNIFQRAQQYVIRKKRKKKKNVEIKQKKKKKKKRKKVGKST
jgi:hypothetical protein